MAKSSRLYVGLFVLLVLSTLAKAAPAVYRWVKPGSQPGQFTTLGNWVGDRGVHPSVNYSPFLFFLSSSFHFIVVLTVLYRKFRVLMNMTLLVIREQ